MIAEEEEMNKLLAEYENVLATDTIPAPSISEEYKDEVLLSTPRVAEGMTKVKYNSSSGKWEQVTDDSEEWYNYANKEWANVVLSAESDGSSIFNSDGTLDESKNYVQLVWIPRYAYKITSQYHTSGSTAGNIDIVFIDTANKGADGTIYRTIYQNATTGGGMDDYVVHPAFDFGGTNLSGFWMGKFETSSVEGNSNSSGDNVTTKTIQVKPNVASWRYITITNMFDVCLEMNKEGNPYGLSTDDSVVDPHMVKNDEWGAVAYLSQSTYGKNSEVFINNSSTYITGNAGSTVSATSASGVTNAYNTTAGQEASTTGNITGVYDMSGGTSEYVAAYVNNGNSALTTNGLSLVNGTEKYKNVYSTGSSDSAENNYAISTPGNEHYGDAVYETSSSASGSNSWYSDFSVFPFTLQPFFIRGYDYSRSSSSGVFAFGYWDGSTSGGIGVSYGFRVVVPVL